MIELKKKKNLNDVSIGLLLKSYSDGAYFFVSYDQIIIIISIIIIIIIIIIITIIIIKQKC